MFGPVARTQPALATPFDNSMNGFVSQDVQKAIEEAKLTGINTLNYHFLSATNNITTTSSADSVCSGMTYTPVAGTYIVMFNSSVTSNQAGADTSVSVYLAGVQQSASIIFIRPFDGGALSAGNARGIVHNLFVVTVNGSQTVDIRWSNNGGTSTMYQRTLILLRAA